MVHLDRRIDKRRAFEAALRRTRRVIDRRWWQRRRVRQLAAWSCGAGPRFCMCPPTLGVFITGWAGEYEDDEIVRAMVIARHNHKSPPLLVDSAC